MCLGTFLRLRRSLFYNLPRRLLRRTFALQMYDNACDIYIVRRSAHLCKLAYDAYIVRRSAHPCLLYTSDAADE